MSRSPTKFFPREALSYALLLVVLFGIAAVAVSGAINFLEDRLASEDDRGPAALMIWSLTLGFMFLSGAFGLWAIKFSAQAESRRRIGRFVDAMDYLQDGLIATDRKGRITGSNPAAMRFAQGEIKRLMPVQHVFPCLSKEDVALLMNSDEPQEVEHRLVWNGASKMVRFRSQPSEGLTLILVGDITAMDRQRLRNRQTARLQLIGQIARGVAHDFNNLLCAISGHASLLSRLPAGSSSATESIRAITQSVDRGSTLAGHLLELAKSNAIDETPAPADESVRSAVETLRNSLATSWRIETDIQNMPALSLGGLQMEQVVVGLGLSIADTLGAPGIIRIAAGTPGSQPRFDVGSAYSGVVLIGSARSDAGESPNNGRALDAAGEPGAILSVLRSLIEEAGGALHCLSSSEGLPIHRVALPGGAAVSREKRSAVRPELTSYVRAWSVLLAGPAGRYEVLERWLREAGLKVRQVAAVASALTEIQEGSDLDALIIDAHLLAPEPTGLLKVILKLRPSLAIVVLSEGVPFPKGEISGDWVAVRPDEDANAIILALVEARSLATRRKPRK